MRITTAQTYYLAETLLKLSYISKLLNFVAQLGSSQVVLRSSKPSFVSCEKARIFAAFSGL